MGNNVAFLDWRVVGNNKGEEGLNEMLVDAIDKLKPDLTLIIKGLGINPSTIEKMRVKHRHPIVGWIFDVTLGGTYVPKSNRYVDFIKSLDMFYTIDLSAVTELKALGVKAEWLPEGCYPPEHKEIVFNSIQERKYGTDVVFLGSVGSIHPNRAEILKRIFDEGFQLKLYGEVLYPENKEPDWVKDTHTGFEAINDYHSLVCKASKVVVGIDGWPHREMSYSARLYRTLCAGGFYLTSNTKGIEKEFVPGKHLDVYNTPDELIEKLAFYLSNDDLRAKIAAEGQKLVLEKHTFEQRLNKIIFENTQ
jgi:spore maturation protein CgeB